MPFSEFTPGPFNPLDAVDSGVSLMDRIRARNQEQQRLDMQAQVNQATLKTIALQQTQQDLQNKSMQANLDVQLKQADLDKAKIGYDAQTQAGLASARTANAQIFSTVPQRIQELTQMSASTDPRNQAAFFQKLQEFNASTAGLQTDPAYAQQFHAAAAPLFAAAASRGAAFQTMSRDAAARIRANITRAQTPQDLAAVAEDPMFPYASDPNFGGSADLHSMWSERQKGFQEFQVKQMEAQTALGKQNRELASSASSSFFSSQGQQLFEKVGAAYHDITSATETKQPTNYTDMAALTGFFKMIDPSMGFNASQEEIFKGLQPYMDTLGIKATNVFKNGGLLTPDERMKLKAAADIAFASQKATRDQMMKDRATALQNNGVDPTTALPMHELASNSPVMQAPNTGSPGQVRLPNGQTITGTIRNQGGKLILVEPNGTQWLLKN